MPSQSKGPYVTVCSLGIIGTVCSLGIIGTECSLGIIRPHMFPREHTAPHAPLFGTSCSLVRNVIMPVLELKSGYTVKYGLSPRDFLVVQPSENPSAQAIFDRKSLLLFLYGYSISLLKDVTTDNVKSHEFTLIWFRNFKALQDYK